MNIQDLRAERKQLEQQLFDLFVAFAEKTGLGVVAVDIKTVTYSAVDHQGCITLAKRVSVELERI